MNDEEIKELIDDAVLVDEDGEPIADKTETEDKDTNQMELHEFEW